MALIFYYDVVKMDGTCHKTFRSQKKAEDYARNLKQNEADKIQITRSCKGMTPYVYYV